MPSFPSRRLPAYFGPFEDHIQSPRETDSIAYNGGHTKAYCKSIRNSY